MVSGIVQGFSVPWLSESPAEFDVPVGATVNVTVTLYVALAGSWMLYWPVIGLVKNGPSGSPSTEIRV